MHATAAHKQKKIFGRLGERQKKNDEQVNLS